MKVGDGIPWDMGFGKLRERLVCTLLSNVPIKRLTVLRMKASGCVFMYRLH